MKDILLQLKIVMNETIVQANSFDNSGLHGGSPDETRAMFIQSIFKNALSHMEAAHEQLKILKDYLY